MKTRQKNDDERFALLIARLDGLNEKVDMLMKQNKELRTVVKRSLEEFHEDLVDVNIKFDDEIVKKQRITATPPLLQIDPPPEQIPEHRTESSDDEKLQHLD
jgi:hypothetical protein